MCGIVGIFNTAGHEKKAKKALIAIAHRGMDGEGLYSGKEYTIGHRLHSIVGFIKQPIVSTDKKAAIIANCEIYNWKHLVEKHSLDSTNDAHALLELFHKVYHGNVTDDALDELDGPYAFAFLHDGILHIVRDLLGVKPLWYTHTDGFMFASEKKALEAIGAINIQELNPRNRIEYDIKNDRLSFHDRKFFSIKPGHKSSEESISNKIAELLEKAVAKRIPEKKFGLLFSGGLDSTLLALLLKKQVSKFTCYTTIVETDNMKEADDLAHAKKAAALLGLDLRIVKLSERDVEKQLKRVVPLIEDTNVVKAEVAVTFNAACEAAKKDGCKVMFLGLGSEEIFAGYKRHKDSIDINKECLHGLLKLYERDLYRDDVVTMANGLEARLPFLDKELVTYSLRVPSKFKIVGGEEKHILRVAASKLGLPKEFAARPKKAAQYGSNVTKAIARLTKRAGFKYKSEYMTQFYPGRNLRLGALISTGKDSIYATHIMLRQNYSVDCLITIKSKNPDSYMFHTPAVDLAKLQSEAMGIPLMIAETKGDKEEELKDLKTALEDAKDKYALEGIITGALYSNYQRERIENICEKLGLKVFSPLWHMNQETEVREIISSGYQFILTRIAAEGLDKTWLNNPVDEKMVDRLVLLNKKIGVNIAGEGGEYESLVLDSPIFTKRIKIISSKVVEDSPNSAVLVIDEAKLVDKQV